MNQKSPLRIMRKLVNSNDFTDVVAYHGTSVEMMAKLLRDGQVVAPGEDFSGEDEASIFVMPTRSCLNRVLDSADISVNDVLHLTDYDEREVVALQAAGYASEHRLNRVFGDPLGANIESGEMLALWPPPSFEGDIKELFDSNGGSTLYAWLNAVLTANEIRDLMIEIYHERWGVVLSLRERIYDSIKIPTESEVRFVTDEGLRLNSGICIGIHDISGIYPLGKADRTEMEKLLLRGQL